MEFSPKQIYLFYTALAGLVLILVSLKNKSAKAPSKIIASSIATGIMVLAVALLPINEWANKSAPKIDTLCYRYTVKVGFHIYRTNSISVTDSKVEFIDTDGKKYTVFNPVIIEN